MISPAHIVDILLEGDGDNDLDAFIKGSGILSPGIQVAKAFEAALADKQAAVANGGEVNQSAKDWFYTPAVKFGPGRYEVHTNIAKGRAFVRVEVTLPPQIHKAFDIYSGMQGADFRKQIAVPMEPEAVRQAADKLYAWATAQLQKWSDLAYIRRAYKKLSPETGKQIGNEFRSVFTTHRSFAGWEHNGYIKSPVSNSEAARMAAWMRARVAQLGVKLESFDPEEFVRSSGVAPEASDFRFISAESEPGDINFDVYTNLARDPWNPEHPMHIGEIVKHKALEADWGIAGGAAFGPATSVPHFSTPDWGRRFASKEAAAFYLWSLRRFTVGESEEPGLGIDFDKFLRDAGVTVTMDDFVVDGKPQRTMGYSNGNYDYYISYKRLLYKGKPVYLGHAMGYHDYNRTGHSGTVGYYVDVPTRTWKYDPRDKQGRRIYKDPKFRTNHGYGQVYMNAPKTGETHFTSLFDCCKYLLSLLKIQHPLKQAESVSEAMEDELLRELGSLATDPILIPSKVKVDFLTANQEAGEFYFTVSLLRSRHSYRHFLGTLKRDAQGQWSIEDMPDIILRKRVEPYPNPDEKFSTDLAAERAMIKHIVKQFPGLLTPRW